MNLETLLDLHIQEREKEIDAAKKKLDGKETFKDIGLVIKRQSALIALLTLRAGIQPGNEDWREIT